MGCKLLSSHLKEAAATLVLGQGLPLWGLCSLEILRRSSPDASDALLFGSYPQEFWHQNPVLFFVCFAILKWVYQGVKSLVFIQIPCPTDIPDPHPLLLTSPLTPQWGISNGRRFRESFFIQQIFVNAYDVLTSLCPLGIV